MADPQSTSEEIWLPVVGYEGFYEVSNLGRVRSLRFINGQADRLRTVPLIMRISTAPNYPSVTLSSRDVKKARQLHRLVLAAFVGPCPAGCEGTHLDGDKYNGALVNLAWRTKRENEADKRRHGTVAQGSRSGTAKLSESDVLAIRAAVDGGAAMRDVARCYGVSKSNIEYVAARKSWRHV